MTLTLTYPRWLMAAVAALTGTERREREEAFAALLHDYDPMIRRICFGYARSAAELDDLHQDALLHLWQALPQYRGEASRKTWAYRITLNSCVSALRSRRPESADLFDTIDSSDEQRQLMADLHEAIAQLPPLDKAIVMARLDDLSYDEIAAMTGMPRNTVATRLRRAKEKLKNIFLDL